MLAVTAASAESDMNVYPTAATRLCQTLYPPLISNKKPPPVFCVVLTWASSSYTSKVVVVATSCEPDWAPMLRFANPLSVHFICACARGAARAQNPRQSTAAFLMRNDLLLF